MGLGDGSAGYYRETVGRSPEPRYKVEVVNRGHGRVVEPLGNGGAKPVALSAKSGQSDVIVSETWICDSGASVL